MKKKLLENISLNFLIGIISYIFSFLTIIYITRTLLPEMYGQVSFVKSVIGYFLMFSALGMPVYGMRTCAAHRNNRKELSKVFNELLSINILFAVIAIITLIISVFWIPLLRANYILFSIYAISIILQTIGCEWLFKGLEKFKFLAVATFCTKLFAFICILLFVHSGKDMLIYLLLAVIAGYGSNFVCFLNLHKYVDFSFRLTIKKEHIKALLIFFTMSCAVTIYTNLDITMLGFMRNNYETGLYTFATKIKIFLTIISGTISMTLMPRVTELWKKNEHKKFFNLSEKSLTWICLIQLSVTIFCFIFAKEIILIIGGKDYLGCITSFRILLLSLFPIGYSNVLGNMILIPCGFERKLLIAEIVGAFVNFFANLALIPILSGIGAAITTVISEFIVLFLCVFYIKHILKVDLGLTMLYKMPQIAIKSLNKLKLNITNKFIKK